MRLKDNTGNGIDVCISGKDAEHFFQTSCDEYVFRIKVLIRTNLNSLKNRPKKIKEVINSLEGKKVAIRVFLLQTPDLKSVALHSYLK